MPQAFWKKKIKENVNGISDDEFLLEKVYQITPEDRALYYDFCNIPGTHFQVYIHPDALRNAHEHSKRGLTNNKEIAGVLIGNFFIDQDKKVEFVEIVNTLEAYTNQSSSVDVNIPATEWSRMMEVVEQSPKYRGKWTIVGWYHSHPNMKAFMSVTDQTTQLQHFNNKGQVAIVLGVGNGYSEVKCFDHKNKEVNLYFYPQDSDRNLTIANLKQKTLRAEKKEYSSKNSQNTVAVLDSIISSIFQNCVSESENFQLQNSLFLKGHIRGFDKWYPNLFLAISYYLSTNIKHPEVMIANTETYTSVLINVGKIEHKIDINIISQIKSILEYHFQNDYHRSLEEINSAIKECDYLLQTLSE